MILLELASLSDTVSLPTSANSMPDFLMCVTHQRFHISLGQPRTDAIAGSQYDRCSGQQAARPAERRRHLDATRLRRVTNDHRGSDV